MGAQPRHSRARGNPGIPQPPLPLGEGVGGETSACRHLSPPPSFPRTRETRNRLPTPAPALSLTFLAWLSRSARGADRKATGAATVGIRLAAPAGRCVRHVRPIADPCIRAFPLPGYPELSRPALQRRVDVVAPPLLSTPRLVCPAYTLPLIQYRQTPTPSLATVLQNCICVGWFPERHSRISPGTNPMRIELQQPYKCHSPGSIGQSSPQSLGHPGHDRVGLVSGRS